MIYTFFLSAKHTEPAFNEVLKQADHQPTKGTAALTNDRA
ncbi:hypothetical protein C942_00241 [Photobacterium marinum]|uniref:Uncharacterized protein n=1 Tax=Photobacterium marinum TaxID=1056511 RepID=L8JI67_9GAMM|nr:hypothetical protein C942_00241 [Photobacterium marinum]